MRARPRSLRRPIPAIWNSCCHPNRLEEAPPPGPSSAIPAPRESGSWPYPIVLVRVLPAKQRHLLAKAYSTPPQMWRMPSSEPGHVLIQIITPKINGTGSIWPLIWVRSAKSTDILPARLASFCQALLALRPVRHFGLVLQSLAGYGGGGWIWTVGHGITHLKAVDEKRAKASSLHLSQYISAFGTGAADDGERIRFNTATCYVR